MGASGLDLMVDPELDVAEVARFFGRVVAGPGRQDCWLWTGAIGDDGYGRFAIRRAGVLRMVRTPRYALAVAAAGRALDGGVRALHGCDVPLCVRVVDAHDVCAGVRQHVVEGTQRENMIRMARARRGGGSPAVIARRAGVAARREQSRALRAAVRSGWDGAAVEAALLGGQPRLW